jgi:hypothetical protein
MALSQDAHKSCGVCSFVTLLASCISKMVQFTDKVREVSLVMALISLLCLHNQPVFNLRRSRRRVRELLCIHLHLLRHQSLRHCPPWQKGQCSFMKRIPKSAGPACASLLTNLLRGVTCNLITLEHWSDLLHFGANVLQKPYRTVRRGPVLLSYKPSSECRVESQGTMMIC